MRERRKKSAVCGTSKSASRKEWSRVWSLADYRYDRSKLEESELYSDNILCHNGIVACDANWM
jgi:hypothetical protein